jgi:hypothetical protein
MVVKKKSLMGNGTVYLFTIIGMLIPSKIDEQVTRAFGGGRGVKPTAMNAIGNAIHIGAGVALCALPVSYATWLTLRPVPL